MERGKTRETPDRKKYQKNSSRKRIKKERRETKNKTQTGEKSSEDTARSTPGCVTEGREH